LNIDYFNCFKDKLHKEAAIEFTNKGYHMLLEKPMATLLDECKEITMASRKMPEQINAVCHVLRYYAPCIKIKEVIDSGLFFGIVFNNTFFIITCKFALNRPYWRCGQHQSYRTSRKVKSNIKKYMYPIKIRIIERNLKDKEKDPRVWQKPKTFTCKKMPRRTIILEFYFLGFFYRYFSTSSFHVLKVR